MRVIPPHVNRTRLYTTAFTVWLAAPGYRTGCTRCCSHLRLPSELTYLAFTPFLGWTAPLPLRCRFVCYSRLPYHSVFPAAVTSHVDPVVAAGSRAISRLYGVLFICYVYVLTALRRFFPPVGMLKGIYVHLPGTVQPTLLFGTRTVHTLRWTANAIPHPHLPHGLARSLIYFATPGASTFSFSNTLHLPSLLLFYDSDLFTDPCLHLYGYTPHVAHATLYNNFYLHSDSRW